MGARGFVLLDEEADVETGRCAVVSMLDGTTRYGEGGGVVATEGGTPSILLKVFKLLAFEAGHFPAEPRAAAAHMDSCTGEGEPRGCLFSIL